MMDNNMFRNLPFEVWTGVVEARDDPLFLGRCKIRILGYHSNDKTETPTEELPWAMPIQGIVSASTSGVGMSPVGVVPGTWVVGFFMDNKDQQIPVFFGTFGSYQTRKIDTKNNEIPPSEKPKDERDAFGVQVDKGVLVDNEENDVRTDNITAPPGWRLGKSSELAETSGRGPGTINDYQNINDPGGASYGSWQLASYLPEKMPNGKYRIKANPSPVLSFIRGSKYKNEFEGLMPATTEFDSKWKEIAARETEQFYEDQYDYIKNNYYKVMISKLKNNGLDLTRYGAGVQDLVWSTAVQFGPNRLSLFLVPLKGKTQLTDKEIIELVTNYKMQKLKEIFPSGIN